MPCSHLQQFSRSRATPVNPRTQGCEECLRTGQRWVQLRLCMTCGHVGCCDSSPGRHATGHFHETQHPVMKSFEPGQTWAWCYPDEEMVGSIESFPQESLREPPAASP